MSLWVQYRKQVPPNLPKNGSESACHYRVQYRKHILHFFKTPMGIGIQSVSDIARYWRSLNIKPPITETETQLFVNSISPMGIRVLVFLPLVFGGIFGIFICRWWADCCRYSVHFNFWDSYLRWAMGSLPLQFRFLFCFPFGKSSRRFPVSNFVLQFSSAFGKSSRRSPVSNLFFGIGCRLMIVWCWNHNYHCGDGPNDIIKSNSYSCWLLQRKMENCDRYRLFPRFIKLNPGNT